MSRGIVLHIGAPKTASTTLQRCLFARHPDVRYVGEEGDGWSRMEDAAVAERMIFSDDLFFSLPECRQIFDMQRAAAGSRAFVYSNGDIMTSRRPTSCAQRLHSLLPDAKVLVVLRNQYTALASYWANHGAFLKPAPLSHFCRFVELDDWLDWGVRLPEDTPFANFFYDEIVELYAGLWGRDKVHLLLFEDFLADQEAFVWRLAEWMNIEPSQAVALCLGGHERRRNSGRLLAWQRFYSRWLWGWTIPEWLPLRAAIISRWQSYLDAGAPARVEIPKYWRRSVAAVYATGNRRLVRDWGLNLAAYGYPLSEES